MKRLLILSLLILVLTLSAAVAENTISLTAEKTELMVGEMAKITISAPGAEAVRLYRVAGEGDYRLRNESQGSTLTYSYGNNSSGYDDFVAEAKFGGVWQMDTDHVLTITFTSQGPLDRPVFIAPNSVEISEEFQVTVSEVPHAEQYEVSIYRTVNGSFQQVDSKSLNAPGSVTFSLPEPGDYSLSVSVKALGWDAVSSNGTIAVTGEVLPVPQITMTSGDGPYYMGSVVSIHAELEGATSFTCRQENDASSDITVSEVNGQADFNVEINWYHNSDVTWRVSAVLNGKTTGFSDPVHATVSSIPSPTLTFDSTVVQGDTLTITVGNMPSHWQKTQLWILDENNQTVYDKAVTDPDNPALNINTWMFEAGNYTVQAIQYITDTSTGSSIVRIPLTVTANPNPPEVGTILFEVSDEAIYTGSELTVFAYAPGADRVRICNGSESNVRSSSSGERAIWTTQHNSANTLNLFAQAAYNGGDWSVTSETKQVEVRSNGPLDAPTFDCKTEFNTGEPITVTLTGTVAHAEIYEAFLTTLDHARVHPSIKFNGRDTVTFDGISEPGEYIVSVNVRAAGWSNNQTNQTILVKSADANHMCGDNVTWSLADDGTLTVSGSGAMFSYYDEEMPWDRDAIRRVVVEPGVTRVGGNAFMGCSNLASVQLPAGLERIGQWAFAYCGSLTAIDLPSSLTSIGANAFQGCGLHRVVIPADVDEIGYGTFWGCLDLEEVVLPSGLTRIGKNAFYSCMNLTSLNVPSGISDIDDHAFVGCSALKALRLPDMVNHLGESVFAGSNVAIFCNSANSNTAAWAQDQGLTVFALANTLVLPADTRTIESEAFANLGENVIIDIPDSATSIAEDAFNGSTVAFRCGSGSAAASFAIAHGIPVVPD